MQNMIPYPAYFLYLLGVIAFLSVLEPGHARELKIAFGQNRPPFVFQENGRWQGFEMDIVREALRHKGHSIKDTTHMPNKRLAIAVSAMGYDAAAAVQFIDDGSWYSDNFIAYENYAISKTHLGLKIESIKDLTRYNPVAWRNAYRNLGPEYEKYFGPHARGGYLENYQEIDDQSLQNMIFWRDEANVLIVDKTLFQWFRKRLAARYDTTVPVVYHDIFPQKTYYRVNFIDKALRDDFNEGLSYLKETGRYQQLIENYLH